MREALYLLTSEIQYSLCNLKLKAKDTPAETGKHLPLLHLLTEGLNKIKTIRRAWWHSKHLCVKMSCFYLPPVILNSPTPSSSIGIGVCLFYRYSPCRKGYCIWHQQRTMHTGSRLWATARHSLCWCPLHTSASQQALLGQTRPSFKVTMWKCSNNKDNLGTFHCPVYLGWPSGEHRESKVDNEKSQTKYRFSVKLFRKWRRLRIHTNQESN